MSGSSQYAWWALAACVATVGCSGTQRWPEEDLKSRAGTTIDDAWKQPEPLAPEKPAIADPAASARVAVDVVADGGVYRNTYYDFPREGAGDKRATVYDASCAPIAKVTQAFHDDLCVQGSGRLAMGETVSFAKRECACAAVCPRTRQRICFERLDPARFPHGRGATGGPITPLVTVAVDTSMIPLGTPVFVPEFVGLPRADGSAHDGCFIAQDRGVKVVGKHIDVFTGDPAMTAAWNVRVPSNQGVHVRVGDPRCARR
jgi:3D (Asp-Asp-Asp) domain-containing protein